VPREAARAPDPITSRLGYRDLDDKSAARRFVEFTEGLIEGTDVNHFVLMVDPRRQDMA
jgi:hypothetical protein